MDKIPWEIKSPQGKSTRCISDNIRDAVKQSKNLVIDLRRIKLPDEKCLDQIQKEFALRREIKNILVISKFKEKSKKLLIFSRNKYNI